ncbi:MAG: hypothetical protein K1X36_03815 [Pyrinomonadaceae bacterium]|nr:hypothetical protein [Pyrinomonadaceae bacterium]
MRKVMIGTIEVIIVIGMLAVLGFGQSAPAARAATVTAILDNTSDRSVLIWTSDSRPQTLADVAKFRVNPGSKKRMVVNLGANGQVKFTASAGPPPDKSSVVGRILGSCVWQREPNAPPRTPYIVFNGSGLTCGSTGQ